MSIKLSTSRNQPIPQQTQSKEIILAKVLLVAIIIAGLVAATAFSAGALAGMVAAGAIFWKIALVSVGCVASGLTTLGAAYFAAKNKMFEDTGHNFRDTSDFVVETFSTAVIAGAAGLNLVKEILIWDVLIKAVSN